jgi:hypothetical protein
MPESEFLFASLLKNLYRNHCMEDFTQGTILDSNDGFRWRQFTTLLYRGNNTQYSHGSGAVRCSLTARSLCIQKFCFLLVLGTNSATNYFLVWCIRELSTLDITFLKL